MICKVQPTETLSGKVFLPSSKSYSIRAFMIAACGGKSVIQNASDCDDAKVAIYIARSLGAKITLQENKWMVDAKVKTFTSKNFNVRESGTVLRFCLPLVSLRSKKAVITGEGTLLGRPNLPLTRTLRQMGVSIKGRGKGEAIPITKTKGDLVAGNFTINGSLSSQFVSALLITCPQLKENSKIKLKGKKLVSLDYIQMTLDVLKKSGVQITQRDKRTYLIRGGQVFKGLKNFIVPSDWGLAAFLIASGCLSESDITLNGYFSPKLKQADGRILGFLKKMGVKYHLTTRTLKIKGPSELKGGVFSLKDCPDLVPVMAVLALFAKGKTTLKDIGHARIKESDRISDLRKELFKIGADIRETPNSISILPNNEYKEDRLLDSHNDHRLAMAFSVLGIKLGVRVKNIGCVSKSYPHFVEDLKQIGVKASRFWTLTKN